MICDELSVDNLQQLSLTNKILRNTVLGLSREIVLSSSIECRLEVICKISKVLIINSSQLNYDAFRDVLERCRIEKIKVAVGLTRNQINYLTMIIKCYEKVKQIYTLPNAAETWHTVKRVKKAKYSVISVNTGLDRNVIESVDSRYVPGISLTIQAFNCFKKTVLRKLKINQKVDNPAEALSLNNIMLSSSPRFYSLEVSDQLINNIDVNSIVALEDVLIAESILEEITMAMISGVSAAKQRLKILQVEHLDQQSHFVVRFLTMMSNLLQKVSLSWQISAMTEDTLSYMILDPIMNAFLDNEIQDVQYHGSDYELPESRARKLHQAAMYKQSAKNVRGRKPDRSASINGRHVFLAELKTAKKAQDRSDLVKIGTLMKDVIDVSLQKGYPCEEVSVVGLLVEGENCSMHVMQSPSKALYCMHQISKFKLPLNQNDLETLVDTSVSFEICRAFVLHAAQQALHEPEEMATVKDIRWNSFSPAHHAEYYA
ncbi:hypothetical protein PS15m_000554 [Mucor circinelloides]